MRIYSLPAEAAAIADTPRTVALGVFDGVHLGHRAVISRAVGLEGSIPAVFTFTQPPWRLPKDSAWELLSSDGKIAAMESLGVEEMFEADFEAIRLLSPEEFVRRVLRDILRARRVFCGFNFRFGRDGAGDAAALTALGEQYGFETVVVPPVLMDGEPISSSRIRRLVETGEVR